MSFNLILEASLPDKLKEENRPVSPTLVVGLGGTGKDVLFRLRRLIVERFGQLERLPFVQFLHLDTDQTSTAQEQYDIRADDDPLYPQIRFRPAEKVDLTLEGGTGRYIEHIGSFPHIKRWFLTDGKLADLGDLGKGAGQVRMASRLGFYDAANFERITSKIDATRRVLKDAGNQARASALDFELDATRVNVFVIGSLAGGTGAGIFLDVGYLLKQHFTEADRTGIFLLPGFFAGYTGADRIKANGYAALMELNHYSFGARFLADWDGAGGTAMVPPPYSTTYLIDSENEGGLQVGSNGKELAIYQMVADTLFQDFSVSKFAGMKRSVRINLENFKLGVYSHNYLNQALDQNRRNIVGDTYPTRFSSFGLSSITFPSDRLHRSCGARMARAVLDLWEQELLADPLETLFLRFLVDPQVRFVQGEYERRDRGGSIEGLDVEDALLRYNESGDTFPALIWQRVREIRTDLEVAPTGEKARILAERRAEVERLISREHSQNREEWGQWIRTLDTNAREYLERLKTGMSKRAAELADDDQYGAACALSMLRELKSLLRSDTYKYIPYFQPAIETWRDAAEEYGNLLDQLASDIERHERQLLFRAADLERDLSLLVADDPNAEELGDFYTYLYARVMRQVARRGLWICEQIDEFLGKDDPTGSGLIGEYYRLLEGFRKLRERLVRKERYFSRPAVTDLSVNLYREGDLDTWYARWMGEGPEERQRLRAAGNRLLGEVFEVGSVTAALQKISSAPAEEIEERMFAQCTDFFAAQADQPSALRLLLRDGRFTPGERTEKVKLAYNLAKVWLARAQIGLEHVRLREVTAAQRPLLIGLDTGDAVLRGEFEQLIDSIRLPGDSAPTMLSIGERNRGSIVFFSEVAGVPAFLPRSIHAPGGLRSAYRNFVEKDELHIHKNRFQFDDLVPKTTEQAKRFADSLRAFLLARALGILRIKEIWEREAESPSLLYSYKRQESFTVVEIPLGTEPQAVETLYDQEGEEHLTDRNRLLREIEGTVDRLRDLKLLSVYALIVEFYMHIVYPKDQVTVGGERLVDQYSAEHAVLSRARDEISDLVGRTEEMDKLKVAISRLRAQAGAQPDDEKLSYEQYMAALESYVTPAGKVAIQIRRGSASTRAEWFPAPVLDRARVLGGATVIGGARPEAKGSAEGPRKRPCPSCGEAINVRATRCIHCRKTVATAVTCPHCGEEKVPDDLAECWNCGRRMPRTSEPVECPSCFEFTGDRSEFPCPGCGFDWNDSAFDGSTAPGPEASSWSGGNGSAGPEASEPSDADEPTATASPPPGAGGSRVRCPSCFEEVEAAAECSFCGGPLRVG